jgi:hypothetical protein
MSCMCFPFPESSQDVFLNPPYGAPEHRSRNREKRASCLSPRRVFCARRVEASADSGEKYREKSRHPGALSFGYFSLGKQRKVTQGAGAELPAIMQLSAGEARTTEGANPPKEAK